VNGDKEVNPNIHEVVSFCIKRFTTKSFKIATQNKRKIACNFLMRLLLNKLLFVVPHPF